MVVCEWCEEFVHDIYRVIAQLDKENKVYEYVCEICFDNTLSKHFDNTLSEELCECVTNQCNVH